MINYICAYKTFKLKYLRHIIWAIRVTTNWKLGNTVIDKRCDSQIRDEIQTKLGIPEIPEKLFLG